MVMNMTYFCIVQSYSFRKRDQWFPTGTLGCPELVPGLPPIITNPWSLVLFNQLRVHLICLLLTEGAASQKRLENNSLCMFCDTFEMTISIATKYLKKQKYGQGTLNYSFK